MPAEGQEETEAGAPDMTPPTVDDVPAIEPTVDQDRHEENPTSNLWMPPGHFHSPIPDIAEVRGRERELFDRSPRPIEGINMGAEQQLALLNELIGYYGEEDFVWKEESGKRYYADNNFFPYSDAFFLYALMRRFRPSRILEVGSGFSSAVMLDVDDGFMDQETDFHFIEPNPERLQGLLRDKDNRRVRIYKRWVQDMNPDFFDVLEADDILFIDSSHVSKTGSDVNYLFFDVLPRLKPGVLVHIHDVPYPFEYGEMWVYEGRAWNEVYFLRAFLSYNDAFQILLYPSFLATLDLDKARAWLPNCVDPISSSCWLRRV